MSVRWKKFTACVLCVVVCLSYSVTATNAACLWGAAKDESAVAFLIAENLAALGVACAVTPLAALAPFLEVAAAAIIIGTMDAEAIDWLISWFWDPVNPLLSVNPPGSIYRPISDAEIDALIPTMLNNAGFTNNITVSQMLTANNLSPGLGTRGVSCARSSIRLAVHLLQGAAAYNAESLGDRALAVAAVQSELPAFRNECGALAAIAATTTYSTAAGGVAPLGSNNGTPGCLPGVTLSQFTGFLSNVNANGQSALPAGEVANIGLIFSLAGVYIPGSTVGAQLTNFVKDTTTCPANLSLETALFSTDSTLSAPEVMQGADVTLWSRINLNQSPILQGFGVPALSTGGAILAGLLLMAASGFMWWRRRKLA